MGDLNWISIEQAVRKYFVTVDVLSDLCASGDVDTKRVQIKSVDYIRVPEHQIASRFERREPSRKTGDRLETLAIGAASGLIAAGAYDLIKLLTNSLYSGGPYRSAVGAPRPFQGEFRATSADCSSLLLDDILYDGWEHLSGATRSFYVRGTTTFRAEISGSHTLLNDIIASREGELALLTVKDPTSLLGDWLCPGFKWNEPLGKFQLQRAFSLRHRQPLRFDKAVKCILWASYYQTLLNREPIDVNGTLRIEPAVFYIRDFNSKTLETMTHEGKSVVSELHDRCAQANATVYSGMASGKTVTRRLAACVREYTTTMSPELSIGPVDFRYREGNCGASTKETLHSG